MNPVIVFDLGKVLVDFEYGIAAGRVAARSRLSMDKIRPLIEQSRFIIDYESGRLNRQEFFECVRGAAGFEGAIKEFSEFFADIFTEIKPMTKLHAELRQRGFKTYIFSNTNDIAVEHIERNFHFFKNFDGYIYSYKVGAMKPDLRVYEAMEKLCGRVHADIIYIDDRAENVRAGASRGWWTLLHESPEKTRAALEAYLDL